MPDTDVLRTILDLARWAPSGDNTQPWRFELPGDGRIVVHGFDTRDHVVYDLDGHPSQLAVGALLENIAIAATVVGCQAVITRRTGTPDTDLLFDILVTANQAVVPDHLAGSIERRVVQRRPMSVRPLTDAQKERMEASLPQGFSVCWFEGWKQRWRLAKLMFDNAKVRLIIPEAFAVHRAVIEWQARYSNDRIPDQAVGVDPVTARFMRWAMADWRRVDFLNKWMLGDLAPRLQLDILPGLFCAAHIALLAPSPLRPVDDYVQAGRAMQRFWLTATQLGLFLQPEMTPLIFSRYVREGRTFTSMPRAQDKARNLADRLREVVAGRDADALFMARVGQGPAPRARSLRRPLDELIMTSS
jgi:hypothetical protein